MNKLSAKLEMSSDVGFGLDRNAFSRATRTVVSMEVRFLRRRPMHSDCTEGQLRRAALTEPDELLLVLAAAAAATALKTADPLDEELSDRFRSDELELIGNEATL
jgi:hypothetical protein